MDILESTGRDAERTTPTISLEATAGAKLNLADFQNAVPMLRELVIVNETDVEARDLELRIESAPPFLKPRHWRVDAVGPGNRYRISDLDVQLDGGLLSRLTEAEKASLAFTLRHSGAEGQELAKVEKPVELLPRNHWGGLSHVPEMVAAFVQPNEPAVERVLKRAAEILRKNGKDPALDGYARGPRHAWEISTAVWGAVASMGLDYALPPASFEQTGQKVRSPSQITDAGLATCLDLTLLFCACLEQAGLNPLVVCTKGHAFAGVWLRAEEFSTAVVDDVTALRKRLKLNELVLFETTAVVSRPAPSFSHAAALGARKIAEENEADFELAVDIRRARLQRIKPLAAAEPPAAPSGGGSVEGPEAEPEFDDAPGLPEDETPAEPDPAELSPKDRLARWQRKLLDLSLRNNLLNFREGKKSVRLVAPDAGKLEDVLSDEKPLRILARPDLMDGADPRSLAIFEGREREDVRRQHALDALEQHQVFAALQGEELECRLVEVYRAARAALQEGGANTLFLALGFLSWTRDDKPGQRHRAPLILVPVTLNRRSIRSGFTLTLHDDEPRFNPTLVEMLRHDFKLNLGVADGDMPRDGSGIDVAKVWSSVRHAIKDIKGWEVSEEVVLATFSFAKYLMWKDLADRSGELRQNPVVRHLIDAPREVYASDVDFPAPRTLDRDYGPERTFCPLPADSSQLAAVMAADAGKDFVLIGPPGTGKSQTIANLIAQCLASGKRVLFVSEKTAALDVVYRRLKEVGLGDFCLELHSNKARKLEVLAQLHRAWEARGDVDREVWAAEARRLKRLREELNAYVDRLHRRRRNGLTVYDAIGRVASGQGVAEVSLRWNHADAHDAAAMDALREAADRLAVNARAVGPWPLADNPLSFVAHIEWSPAWQQGLADAAQALARAARDAAAAFERYREGVGLPALDPARRVRDAIAVLARELPNAAGRDWRFVLRPDARTIADRCRNGISLLTRHWALTLKLSPPWPESVAAECRRGIALVDERCARLGELNPPWPAAAVDELRRGLSLLADIEKSVEQLSVPYGGEADRLDLAALQDRWRKAERSLWPSSWLGRRHVRRQLEGAAEGRAVPQPGKDVGLLLTIRGLKEALASVEAGPLAAPLWAGLMTDTGLVERALAFQDALAAARAGGPWIDDGFEAVAEGRCGKESAADLTRMRRIRAIDEELGKLEHLGPATGGLWTGATTRTDLLGAALRFRGALEQVRAAGALPGTDDEVARGECGQPLAEDLEILRERTGVERNITSLDDLRALTAEAWKGLATDVPALERALDFGAALTASVADLASTPEEIDAVRQPLERLLGQGNPLLESTGRLAAAGTAYRAAWEALPPLLDALLEAADAGDPVRTELKDGRLDELIARCEGVLDGRQRLHAWCAWRKARAEAVGQGLSPLVASIEGGTVPPGAVREAFETNYCRWWLNAAVDVDDVLRTFVSAEHERRIEDFRDLDDRVTDLNRAHIRAGLCENLPLLQGGTTRNSEWGVLKHELTKKKRHMPLRELMERIPTALPKLTPCLLMSPLSIAQYLRTDTPTFDLVVFDEASQIPVWDAIGAMARGRQVVMVGDPKQLPPTSFFDRAESEIDDEDVEGDLESILDECMGASLPVLDLSWHYRSRHESLIAFSNHRYYGGRLVTFPSPVTEDRAVSFHPVRGNYEKGGARVNKSEARALVADLVARLKAPGFRESRQTVGVVTFNSEQQSLIEDLLDEARRREPAIECHFAETELEPVFVKNLESVQGDERDIMYFSTTYGPDLTGSVSMNFGPLNRQGGERRLNVAVTRARRELRVFSSLRADQVDLARTRAEGVKDLKHFLDFAERGPRALAEATFGSRGDFESPFEMAVAAALGAKGWDLHTQVGASAFRIDLAVVHPDAGGAYLAGIECDGATYHRSATARDRDKLREQVLRRLGWNILRVWSTDWWVNPADTLEKLDEGLRELLEASRERRAAEEAASALAAPEACDEPPEDEEPEPAVDEDIDLQLKPPVARPPVLPAQVYARQEPFETGRRPPVLVESDPASVVDTVDPGAFYDGRYDRVLAKMIAHVVEAEGPVLDEVLARRIARAHGWQRTGARIQERVHRIAKKAHRGTKEDVGTFYWPQGHAPDAPVAFRKVHDGIKRGVHEVCLPELVALARSVLNGSATGEDALVAMARELGLQKLRAASRDRLVRALAMAQGQ